MNLTKFKEYIKVHAAWKNKPDKSTPIDAAALMQLETGIKSNNEAIQELAVAVVSQITNDPNKIASMAALFAVNETVASLNRDLNDRTAVSDLLAIADVGLNAQRIIRCNNNTLNTPYKAGLTAASYGTAYIGMISANAGTILYVCDSVSRIFLRAKDSGKWGDWISVTTNADYPGYKQLWSGTITTNGATTIPGIASYNTYAIVSSSYPAVLWGQRWGSKISAFGFDGNASNAFRLMSVILSIDGDKITVTKSKVAAMTFGAVNGSASDLPITNIYGIS